MNREMRRSGFFKDDDIFEPYSDGVDNLDEIESFGNFEDNLKIKQWKKILTETERPDHEFGVLVYFLVDFIKPEMRDAFREIAIKYLRDRKQQSIFHLPEVHLGEIQDPFEYFSLAAILGDALEGNSYAKEIILSLYKTYYKREYNFLKRVDTFSMDTAFSLFGKEGMYVDEERGVRNSARITVMCNLLGKNTDPSWNYNLHTLNQHIADHEIIWRSIGATGFTEPVKEAENARRREYADFLMEHYPEMASREQYERQDRYETLYMAQDEAERGLELSGMTSDILDDDFDLFECAIASMSEVPDEGEIDSVLLTAYIYYLGRKLGEERKRNREIYKRLTGMEEDNIIDPNDISGDGFITDGEMADYLESLRDDKVSDRMSEKVLAAVGRLKSDEDSKVQQEETAIKEAEEEDSDIKKRLQERENELRELKIKNKSLNQMYAELKEKNRAIEEKNRALTEQLVKCKAAVEPAPKSAVVSEEQPPVDISPLLKIKGAVVGGHVSWQKKMKEHLPGWLFISVDDSLSELHNIVGADAVFLYTDAMSHVLYYKIMQEIRKRGIKFYHLHGVNIEKVLQSMVKSIEGA